MPLVCDQCRYENKDDALLCNLCGKVFRKVKKPAPASATRRTDQAQSKKWSDEAVPHVLAGRLDEALACCEKSIEADPYNGRAWTTKAGALSRKRDPRESHACYVSALAVEPHILEAWHGKAFSEYELGELASALRSLQELKLLATGGLPPDVASEVDGLLAELTRRGVAPSERTAIGWMAEGSVRGADEQFARALACMEKALELDPSLALAWHLKAGALEKLGREEEASASQEKATELEPGNPSFWHWKGVHLKKLRRYEEAVAAYDRAIAIDPGQPGYWSDRGLSLANLKRSAEAIECYDKAIALAPEAPAPWYNKALEADRLGRVPEAVESYERFIRFATPAMVPQVEQARLRIAELRGSRDPSPQAVDSPASPPSAFAAGAATGVADEASAKVDAVLYMLPALVNIGSRDQALAMLDQAMRIAPHRTDVRFKKAEILFDDRRFEEAVACLDEALAIEPENVPVWILRGDCFRALGHSEDAVASYDRALERMPEDHRLRKQVLTARDMIPSK